MTGGGQSDLYLRDLQEGLTKLVTVDASGTSGGDNSQEGLALAFSGDASTLIFDSTDTNLQASDRNMLTNTYAASTAGYGVIRGEVFDDLNANGSLDSGEKGLPYWTVTLNGTPTGGECSDHGKRR